MFSYMCMYLHTLAPVAVARVAVCSSHIARRMDEGDQIRTMLRMDAGGVRNGDRHTYLIDADGRVQGQLNNFADPFAHSAMAPPD